jgi:capsular polysaccharide biosynthesis protein
MHAAEASEGRAASSPALLEHLLQRGLLLPRHRDGRFEILQLVAGRRARPAIGWHRHFPLACVVTADLSARSVLVAGVAVTLDPPDAAEHNLGSFLLALGLRVEPLVILDAMPAKHRLRGPALAMLYPVLRPGGVYLLEAAAPPGPTGEEDDVLATLGRVAAPSRGGDIGATAPAEPGGRFETFLRATSHSAAIRRRAILVRKRPAAAGQALPAKLRIRSLEDAAPGTRFFDNGGGYLRIPPRLFDMPGPLAAKMHAVLERGPAKPPPARAARLSNCLVLEDGVVVTADGSVIRESLINQHAAHRFAGLYRPELEAPFAVVEAPPRPTALPATGTHVLLKQRWDSNYGHWLIESLPRMAMMREMADPAACRFLVRQPVSTQMRQICLDSLALFGIAAGQVDFVGNEALAISDLIYPAPLTVQPWIKAPLAIRTLEALVGLVQGSAPAGPQRIYVSRNRYQNSRRRLLNEGELLRLLLGRGYRLVEPETLSLGEQTATFAAAGAVIGNLGAALSNLVFSPPGVRVFGLSNGRMMDNFFYDIICHKRGEYWSLHGQAAEAGRGMQSDFTIDLARFAVLLDQFEAGG